MNGRPRDDQRLRLALPNKGRLSQAAAGLVREAGFGFEEDARLLFSPCENFALDLLFVRAEDVGEYVQDGIVDLGVTGSNLLEEHGARVDRSLELGFGRCRLQLAVPEPGPICRLEELEGRPIATSHPNATSGYLRERGVDAHLIEISGAVEVTPLLGVADAIVDLVATGTTLATNGLRPIATLLESQAELVRNPTLPEGRRRLAEHVTLMLASVVAGRQKRYLMMNAPTHAVAKISQVIPGLGSPSVMQLADPAMVALHAVVDASGIWELLGPLRDAGATSILVLPIERLIP